jgi:hypothetical protein
MRISEPFRTLLGVFSLGVALYCCLMILVAWTAPVLEHRPVQTAAQVLAGRVKVTTVSILVGAGFALLARWCWQSESLSERTSTYFRRSRQ